MYRPPLDPRDRVRPTWRRVIVCYALMATVPFVLWAVSQPLAGALVLAAVAGLYAGSRRAVRLARCFHDCGGFALDLGGAVRITITEPCADDPC